MLDRDYKSLERMDKRLDARSQLPTAAPQQPATIGLQQALASGIGPDVLRAVANWNEQKSHDERRRKARSRHKAQADALRAVADQMDGLDMRRAA